MTDLRALAEKATPGPWGPGYWSGQCHVHPAGKHPGPPKCRYDYELVHGDFDDPHRIVSLNEPIEIAGNYDYEQGGIVGEADARYIAAANPAAILSLLDTLDSLTAERRALEERIDTLEDAAKTVSDLNRAEPSERRQPGFATQWTVAFLTLDVVLGHEPAEVLDQYRRAALSEGGSK